MEISPGCSSITGHKIATKFCTCHDSTAVMPNAKFCSNYVVGFGMRVRLNFHHIWILMENCWWNGPQWLKCYGSSQATYRFHAHVLYRPWIFLSGSLFKKYFLCCTSCNKFRSNVILLFHVGFIQSLSLFKYFIWVWMKFVSMGSIGFVVRQPLLWPFSWCFSSLSSHSWRHHQMETFSSYWPFVRGIRQSLVDSPH